MRTIQKPVVLIIRDGWGVNRSPSALAAAGGDATMLAKTPVHQRLLAEHPWSLLEASGESVGLPEGQMGNSEVGHLNLGAGRVVYQDFVRINKAIKDGTFCSVPTFVDVFSRVRANASRMHLVGLCSDGGVHSHIDHLFALLEMARQHAVSPVFIHCFMDGRDTSPTSGVNYIQQVESRAQALGVGKIATIIGRYFAMDRDNRWDRTAKAYEAMVNGVGVKRDRAVAAMHEWYQKGKTDEFIPPTVIFGGSGNDGEQVIRDGDGVVCFNFRSDRARQLTRSLTATDFVHFARQPWPKTRFVCMTEYDETFQLPIAFPPQRLTNIFAQVVAANGLSQLRVAETEKYPHVTFFFNGGEETPVNGEDRCLIPSPKVATYDLQPEMSAPQVTRETVARIQSRRYDVIILNFANCDMVGHTGNLPAAIRAVEVVDRCVGDVIAAVKDVGGTALVTADHGNAERMIDERGKPFTAHTSNPVHFIYVGQRIGRAEVRRGILADVAPTMLGLLRLSAPAEMTGQSLILFKE